MKWSKIIRALVDTLVKAELDLTEVTVEEDLTKLLVEKLAGGGRISQHSPYYGERDERWTTLRKPKRNSSRN